MRSRGGDGVVAFRPVSFSLGAYEIRRRLLALRGGNFRKTCRKKQAQRTVGFSLRGRCLPVLVASRRLCSPPRKDLGFECLVAPRHPTSAGIPCVTCWSKPVRSGCEWKCSEAVLPKVRFHLPVRS